MARPRKNPDDPKWINQDATERESAPATTTAPYVPPPVYTPPPQPRQMRVERQSDTSAPYARKFPQVRGGICEYCGVLDPSVPSQYQYRLCPHFRGLALRCSYCPDNKDPDDVVYHSNLNIFENPKEPGTLVVICNSFECSAKHLERFKVNI